MSTGLLEEVHPQASAPVIVAVDVLFDIEKKGYKFLPVVDGLLQEESYVKRCVLPPEACMINDPDLARLLAELGHKWAVHHENVCPADTRYCFAFYGAEAASFPVILDSESLPANAELCGTIPADFGPMLHEVQFLLRQDAQANTPLAASYARTMGELFRIGMHAVQGVIPIL